MAERWKRGAEGAETNAEGVRIEAPRGRGMGRGPQPTMDLGSVVSSPIGVQGGAPVENDFSAICSRYKDADSNYLLNFCFIKRCSSLAFHLERLQKFRYGVPPFQKVPVWRSGASRPGSV